MRPEYSRSMSSLPSRSSSAPYCDPGVNPSRTPSGALYQPSRSPHHRHLASDQSLRSASLTSIVEMYQARSPEGSVQPLRSPGSFYYDYSEEFNAKYSDEYGYASPIHSPPGETIDTLRAGDIPTPRDVPPATDFKDMATGNELRGTSDYVSDYRTTPSRERKEPNLDSGSNHESVSDPSPQRQMIDGIKGYLDMKQASIPSKRRCSSSTPPAYAQTETRSHEANGF